MQIFKNDIDKLIALMQAACEGNFIPCKESDFKNKTLACTYNAFLDKFIQSNNQTAMDLNQSMNTIGNCNHVRTMLQVVEHQQNNLNQVAVTGNNLSDSIRKSEKVINTIHDEVASTYNTSQLSKKAMEEMISNVNQSYQAVFQADASMSGFSEKSVAIKNILNIVNDIANRTQILSLNARIEASRSQDGKGFAIVASEIGTLSVDTQESVRQMTQFIYDILKDIEQLVEQFNHLKSVLEISSRSAKETEQAVQEMADKMQNVMNEISDLYTHFNQQNTDTKSFTEHTMTIAKDADLLADYCKQPGKDMYVISRSVDKIRTRLVKNLSHLSVQQLLDVYDTDHLVFTGRLYNMIEGFEQLQLKNLNQPAQCKYGKWMEQLKIKQPSQASAFRQANLYHTRLHELATACYYANESGDKTKAIEFFEEAQTVYKNFSAELQKLKRNCKITVE